MRERQGERVWVNRRSGTAHVRRDCEALSQVPDGALRVVVLDPEGERPHLRFCSWCASA